MRGVAHKYKKKKSITKGVAKLGYSWEAMDVNHWSNPTQLAASEFTTLKLNVQIFVFSKVLSV